MLGLLQAAAVSWEGAIPGWCGLLSCASALGWSCVCVLWPPDSDCVELPAPCARGEDSTSVSNEGHLA